MAAPKCRLCGHNHWNTEPHKFDANVSDSPAPKKKASKKPDSSAQKWPVIDDKPKPVPMPTEAPKTALNPQIQRDRENTRRWREQNRERYRELQREYMRKRRKGL